MKVDLESESREEFSGVVSSRLNKPQCSKLLTLLTLLDCLHRALHEKQTNREEWNREKCMTVWTKKGHGLLPKTNSEYSQMDFPLQSCVNERKQGSASQGLHCDTAYRSSFNSLIEGNLQEFQPSLFTCPSQMVIPGWDTWKTAFQHPADNALRYIYMSQTFSWCQLHLMIFLFCSTNLWNILKIKTNAVQSEVRNTWDLLLATGKQQEEEI